ncbi:MAG TPA: hypothetical protein VER32_08430 [Pyrinomonadaceae bacterium]|nr:hypothetical protein [Pyrinomonadaceae bacterium]
MKLRPSGARGASTLFITAVISASLVAACGDSGTQTNNASADAPRNAATNAAANANTNANGAAANTPDAPRPEAGSARTKLNLNTATSQEFLAAVPNLGNRMVHEFEEYRPYKSIQQFRREIGKYVDEAKVAEYERYVFVPISENESDAATLRQIPGIDASEADQLIAGRPYQSRQAFLERVAGMVSADELNVARAYMGQ